MTEENAKKEKVKKLAVVGNILGCLTIVLFILRFPLESRYGGSILENTAFVTALLTFISYLIRNLILKNHRKHCFFSISYFYHYYTFYLESNLSNNYI